MDEKIRDLLERQATWQRGRAALSWEEKLKISMVMREAQKTLRKSGGPKRDLPKERPASTAQSPLRHESTFEIPNIAEHFEGARPGR